MMGFGGHMGVVSKVPPPIHMIQCAVTHVQKLEVQLWKYDIYCGLSVEGIAALECSLAVQGVKAEADLHSPLPLPGWTWN